MVGRVYVAHLLPSNSMRWHVIISDRACNPSNVLENHNIHTNLPSPPTTTAEATKIEMMNAM